VLLQEGACGRALRRPGELRLPRLRDAGRPLLHPADCPADTTCCLNIADVNNLIVNCQARLHCPGNGADTRIACGSEADCPLVAPSCNVVGKAMGVDFKICSPGSD
jgi:hypothetical protein